MDNLKLRNTTSDLADLLGQTQTAAQALGKEWAATMSMAESLRLQLSGSQAVKEALAGMLGIQDALRRSSAVKEAVLAASETQRRIEEMLRSSSVLSDLRRMEVAATQSLVLLADSAAFRKYDALLSGLPPMHYLFDVQSIEIQLRPVTQQLFESLRPAAYAFEAWREALPVEQIASPSIPLAVPARENIVSVDLAGSLHAVDIFATDTQSAMTMVVGEADDHMLMSLPSALGRLNSDLYRLWSGAWESFRSSNPDRVRHALTSARELFTHVLHVLAPDDDVKAWSKDPAHYHNGKPTRRARLLFALADVSDGHLQNYLVKEVEACIALADVFQAGTHAIRLPFSDRQLVAILRKVHSTICMLVEVRAGASTD